MNSVVIGVQVCAPLIKDSGGGFIETDMTQKMLSNPLVKKMTSRTFNNTILLRRAGKADEIAYTVLFLASNESSYITGTDIVVDGGWFTAGPYLSNERQHHMLKLIQKKEGVERARHSPSVPHLRFQCMYVADVCILMPIWKRGSA